MNYSKDQLALIKTFLENEPLSTLIKDTFLEGLADTSALDLVQSNELLGQQIRGQIEARDIIKFKFTELARLTRTNPQPSSRNESR